MKWKYIKIQQVSLNGDPDLVVCVNGFYVELELKKDSKAKVAKLQIYELMRTVSSGGAGVLCYPENFEEVKEFLINISKATYSRRKVPECLKLKMTN